MKVLFILTLAFLFANSGNAQILKNLAKKIKDDAEWRIRNKADQQVSKGLDSLLEAPKKLKEKKAKKENSPDNSLNTAKVNVAENDSPKSPGNTAIAAKADDDDMSKKDGYVTLQLSTGTVFAGGNILLSGESVNVRNFTSVEITISGPSTKDVKIVPLAADGKYTATWYSSDQTGTYNITVKGSDKKSTQSAQFIVYDLADMDEWCDKNIDLTNKAYDKLKDEMEKVSSNLGSKDKAELKNKMDVAKDKIDALLKLYKDLNTAGKEVGTLARSGKNLSPNLAGNLSELNNKLAEQRKKMEQIEEYRNHEPYDNTICEYLVMLNEACAAFSVYTNIECFALKGILKNIMLDKGVPLATSTINQKANALSQPNDFALKEPAKIFSTAALDAESLTSKLGTAGITGDIVQFATDFLMKKYCGVFKGNLTHDYKVEFRNNSGQNWWTYGVEMKAVFTLRYPKEKGSGKIIKMKGNFEGNATKFSFFEDIEKEESFHEGSKGKIEVVPIKAYIPYSVSFATSERDIMGFGAIARGLATPAYFNIPVDAEYDVDDNKIKIFLNPAIIDFSPAVSNQFIFLLIGGDMLPYIKRMTFPIHKVYRTLSSIVRDNHEFNVLKDAKGNLSFSGKANKHLGDKSSAIEHDLNFTISAKKD